jgi:S1-C subfamily serine protease
VPAIQLFTGPHADYHRPTDTAEKIDHEGLVKVAAVAQEIVEYLSKRQEPLMTAARPAGRAAGGQRKSSLGTIPDFSYAGEGARLSGVMAGSPAEKGGLRAGDVIIGINENPVAGLRDLSEILKSLDPGSRVRIMLLREEKETALEVVLDTK